MQTDNAQEQPQRQQNTHDNGCAAAQDGGGADNTEHARTRASTNACTHARTHARTHSHTQSLHNALRDFGKLTQATQMPAEPLACHTCKREQHKRMQRWRHGRHMCKHQARLSCVCRQPLGGTPCKVRPKRRNAPEPHSTPKRHLLAYPLHPTGTANYAALWGFVKTSTGFPYLELDRHKSVHFERFFPTQVGFRRD